MAFFSNSPSSNHTEVKSTDIFLCNCLENSTVRGIVWSFVLEVVVTRLQHYLRPSNKFCWGKTFNTIYLVPKISRKLHLTYLKLFGNKLDIIKLFRKDGSVWPDIARKSSPIFPPKLPSKFSHHIFDLKMILFKIAQTDTKFWWGFRRKFVWKTFQNWPQSGHTAWWSLFLAAKASQMFFSWRGMTLKQRRTTTFVQTVLCGKKII